MEIKSCLLILVIFTFNICVGQTNKHDFNKLSITADSLLTYKFGACIFKKNIRLKNIEILEDKNDFTYKLPHHPFTRTETIKKITYVLTYSFTLDGYEVLEITMHFDGPGKIIRGGPINFYSEEKNTEESCYLMREPQFGTLKRTLNGLHKTESIQSNVTIYENSIAIHSHSFMDGENILTTYHSLFSGKLLHKQVDKFMP